MTTFMQKLKPRLEALPLGATLKNHDVMLATWFGAGRVRPAPGTIGTLAALPFGYAISYFTTPVGLTIAAALLLWLGTKASDSYVARSGKKDDQTIVVDEVVGVWIAAIPAATHWQLWLAAFVLFRIFDIYKPFPATIFEKKENGKGIDVMMDDVVAGIYAFFGVAALALVITP